MALRIVEKIAYQPAQQPRVATQQDEFAVEGTAIIMRALFRQQGQEVDFLRGRRCSGDVKLESVAVTVTVGMPVLASS